MKNRVDFLLLSAGPDDSTAAHIDIPLSPAHARGLHQDFTIISVTLKAKDANQLDPGGNTSFPFKHCIVTFEEDSKFTGLLSCKELDNTNWYQSHL